MLDLAEYYLPEQLYETFKKWDVKAKSPYGASFYDTTKKTWTNTPEDSSRIADHWNFTTQGNSRKIHCQTDITIPNNTCYTLAKYDKGKDRYIVDKVYINDNKELIDRLTKIAKDGQKDLWYNYNDYQRHMDVDDWDIGETINFIKENPEKMGNLDTILEKYPELKDALNRKEKKLWEMDRAEYGDSIGEDAVYVKRYTNNIEDDFKRNWSSWSFGGYGFDGTKEELDAFLDSATEDDPIDISGIQIYAKDIYDIDIRELSPNYWVVLDPSYDDGLASWDLKTNKLSEALEKGKDTRGEFVETKFTSEDSRVVFSEKSDDEYRYHIIRSGEDKDITKDYIKIIGKAIESHKNIPNNVMKEYQEITKKEDIEGKDYSGGKNVTKIQIDGQVMINDGERNYFPDEWAKMQSYKTQKPKYTVEEIERDNEDPDINFYLRGQDSPNFEGSSLHDDLIDLDLHNNLEDIDIEALPEMMTDRNNITKERLAELVKNGMSPNKLVKRYPLHGLCGHRAEYYLEDITDDDIKKQDAADSNKYVALYQGVQSENDIPDGVVFIPDRLLKVYKKTSSGYELYQNNIINES